MVAQDPIVTAQLDTANNTQLTAQGGEDGIAIFFGLVGALVNAVTWTAMMFVFARQPGVAVGVVTVVTGTYVAGLATLLWIGAAKRGEL